MSEDDLKQRRRSTRLSISIPIVISGVDADGNSFAEGVHTSVVNKHGGKIATNHRLDVGAEILIKNRRGAEAKARVVRVDEEQPAESLFSAALQLVEPQNIWGMEFPPDDWSSELREETPPARK